MKMGILQDYFKMNKYVEKKYIVKEEYVSTEWAGGITTELYRSPVGNDPSKNQPFDFRLSTASISKKNSDFTKLAGYNRIIMSLDKPLVLDHPETSKAKKIHLKPLEAYFFSGDIETRSYGLCQDINLIYKKEINANMVVIKNSDVKKITDKDSIHLIYAIKSSKITINYKNKLVEDLMIYSGDTVVLEIGMTIDYFSIHANSLLILSELSKNQ